MIDDEATVKQYRTRNGKVELVPRKPRYPVIPGDRAAILGKVVCDSTAHETEPSARGTDRCCPQLSSNRWPGARPLAA